MTNQPQTPLYPNKLYSGMSGDEFLKAFNLTSAQIQTLRQLRADGKLY
jgi:hypothetical protein